MKKRSSYFPSTVCCVTWPKSPGYLSGASKHLLNEIFRLFKLSRQTPVARIQTRERCVGPIAIQPLHTGQHLFTRVIKVVPLPYPLLARIGEEVLRLDFKQGQHSCFAIKNEGIDIRRQVALHTSEFYTLRTSHEAFVREKLIQVLPKDLFMQVRCRMVLVGVPPLQFACEKKERFAQQP